MISKRTLRVISLATLMTAVATGMPCIAQAEVVGEGSIESGFIADIESNVSRDKSDSVYNNVEVTTSASVGVEDTATLYDLGSEGTVWENEARYSEGLVSSYTNFDFHRIEIPTEYNLDVTGTTIACNDGRTLIFSSHKYPNPYRHYKYDIKTGDIVELPITSITNYLSYGDEVRVTLSEGGFGTLSLENGEITKGTDTGDIQYMIQDYTWSILGKLDGVSSANYSRYQGINLSGDVWFFWYMNGAESGEDYSKLGFFYGTAQKIVKYRLYLEDIQVGGEKVSVEANKKFSVNGKEYIVVPNYKNKNKTDSYEHATGVETRNGVLVECPLDIYSISEDGAWNFESNFYAIYQVDNSGGFAYNVASYTHRTEVGDDISSSPFITAQDGIAISRRYSIIDSGGNYVTKNVYNYYRYNEGTKDWEATEVPVIPMIQSPIMKQDICVSIGSNTDWNSLSFTVAGVDGVKTIFTDIDSNGLQFRTVQSPGINKLMFTYDYSNSNYIYINYGYHYSVKFLDEAGVVLSEQSVYDGDSAIAPEVPLKEGYAFDGWDTDFDNVTSDLVVTATYKEVVTPPIDEEPTVPPVDEEPSIPTEDEESVVPPVDIKPPTESEPAPPVEVEPSKPSTDANTSSSHKSSSKEAIKIVDVYRDNYIKNSNTLGLAGEYSWSNTIDDLSGTLKYESGSYEFTIDNVADRGIHVVIHDNFKDKKAKLYSYIPDINMYALLSDDITSVSGELEFDTTSKGKYIISSNSLPQEKVINYWYAVNTNQWIFFDKYSDERVTGWHRAGSGEWIHNGKDSAGDYFHMSNDTIMNTGWFRDTDGSWYYLDDLDSKVYGGVLTGWWYLDNEWYYFSLDNGRMSTGWMKVDNNWYYFGEDGAMRSNTSVDGYIISNSGALV